MYTSLEYAVKFSLKTEGEMKEFPNNNQDNSLLENLPSKELIERNTILDKKEYYRRINEGEIKYLRFFFNS